MTFRALLTIGLMLMFAERLPAPIQEEPESTPKPKREAISKPKLKAEATSKPKSRPNRSFAGAWTGSAGDSNGSAVYVIKISDDEKTVWINWNESGKNITGPGLQAPSNRFRETLTWSLTQQDSIETDTLRMNANGSASFVREGRWNGGGTFKSTGTLSRQNASSAPSIRQTATVSSPQTTTGAPPISGLPTAKRVPGNSNLVFSPFDPDKYIDVEGFPSGTELVDPYTGNKFIVP